MSQDRFADALFTAVRDKGSAVVVGMDPDLSLIPRSYFPTPVPTTGVREAVAEGVLAFAGDVIQAVADVAVAIKPQLAYFERLGPPGLAAFEEVVRLARAEGLLVIADGKRNDIAQTAVQYAAAYLGVTPAESPSGSDSEAIVSSVDGEGPKADALTINPYLGWDGIRPFLAPGGHRGIFVLVKTSNPSSGELQDRALNSHREPAERVLDVVGGWLEEHCGQDTGNLGYGDVGAVVGATYPDELKRLRAAMPHVPFLIPGYGAQGGGAQDVADGFDEQGLGAVVNASRSILYAYARNGGTVSESARAAAVRMRDELRRVMDR